MQWVRVLFFEVRGVSDEIDERWVMVGICKE